MRFLETVKKFIEDEAGAEVVEFVIAMPVMLQLVALMVLTMQMIFAKDVALNASSLGCRSAIVQTTYQKAKADADEKARTYADSIGMGVSFEHAELTADSNWSRGNLANYTVTVEADPLFAFGIVGAPVSIGQTATMMIEK